MKSQKIIQTIVLILMVSGTILFSGFQTPNDTTFPESNTGTFIETLAGNNSVITDIPEEMHSDPLIPTTSMQKDLTPDEWIQGETVNVNYTFANHYLEVDTQKAFLHDLGDTFLSPGIYAYHESYSNDGLAYGAGGGKNTDSDNTNAWRYEVQLLARTSGTLYVDGWWTCTGAAIGGSHGFDNQEYSVTSDNIDANGYITVHFESVWDAGGDEYDNAIDIYNFTLGDTDSIWSASFNTPDGPPDRTELRLDELRFQQNPIISYIRSEHQYSIANVLQYRLTIENFEYRITITVYIPEHWIYSSINPIAQVTVSGNDIIVTNTIPTIYLILFSSTSNQFLAISDMSGNYLYDNGFEGSWSNDWVETTVKPFDVDPSLNSTIVYNGALSLRLEDINTGHAYLRSNDFLESGYYYIFFTYYIESFTGGTGLFFQWVDPQDGWILDQALNTTTTNRWQQAFFFIHLDGSTSNGIRFDDTSTSSVFFLDSFQVWEVNHIQETIDYSQTFFSGQFISWDGYSNPVLPYETVQLDLRDWTSDTSLIQYETMTDFEGCFYWIFEGRLEQKNYELRSWSWNNHFGTPSEIISSTTSTTGWTESGGVDMSVFVEDGDTINLTGQFDDSDWIQVTFNHADDWDLSNCDYYVYDWKLSSSTNIQRSRFFLFDTDGDYVYDEEDTTYPSTLTERTWEFQVTSSGGIGTVDYDISDRVIFRLYNSSDTGSTYYSLFIRDIRFIQAQKSHFTPLPVGYSDYAITAQENNPYDYNSYWGMDGWDFQEGTLDDWEEYVSTDDIVVENGTISRNIDQDWMGFVWDIAEDRGYTIPFAQFPKVIFRAKANETFYLSIYFRNSDSGTSRAKHPITVTTVWQVFEYDLLTDFSGSVDVWDEIRFHAYSVGNSYNATLYLDYFRVGFSDSNLESGLSFEFNEVDYDDGWIAYSGASISTANGELTVSAPTQFDGMQFDFETEYSAGDWDYCSFEIKASGITTDMKVSLYIDGETQYTLVVPTVSSTYQVIRIAIDSWGFDEIHLRTHNVQTGTFWVKWFHLEKSSPPNLYESSTDFLLDNEGLLGYKTVTDSFSSPEFLSNEYIPKNLTVGSHSFEYCAYQDYLRWGVFLPSAFYHYEYDIAESDIMKIIIHDQSGNVIPFDSFKTYIDSVRLYDNYIYFSDTSQTFNLTINDLFDNQVYQDTTEAFEQFKEVQLTLYSLKIQNIQENPIWFRIQRGSKYYSEWIFSFEVIEYRLEQADYTIWVYYSDVAGNFSVATNGTYVSYSYTVDSDTAIRITGHTIEDVFGNVMSLTDNLGNVNVSIHNAIIDQTENVTIQFSATNQNITFVLGNSSLIIDNLNSNFTTILSDTAIIISNINSLDTNIASNFTYIFSNLTQIITDVANINVTTKVLDILANTTYIIAQLSDIDINLASNFTFMFSNFTQIFTNIANINVTTEVLDVLANTANILGDLIILDSNIEANFSATFLSIAGNTTLLVNQLNSNFTDMQGLIISNNTVLYTQLVHTLADLAELKGLFTVHFDFVDGIGIGLSWETFKLYLNDSRQYGQEYYTPNQTQIRLKTLDYFNVSLDTANYTINNSCDISVIVDVYEVIFRNNNTQFKSIVEITRGGQSLVLFIEPGGTISHRFTEGKYTLNVSYIVETEMGYEIKNPENYTVGVHNLYKSSFSIGSKLKLLDKDLSSNIVDVGAPDPKPTILGIVQLQIATAFFFGVIVAACFSVLISYIFRTRVIQPIDEKIDFSTLGKGVQKPVVETSSDILEFLPLTERKHGKSSRKKDNRRR